MPLNSMTLDQLLEAFSDPAPTPGGGSAAALAAAVGLSLLTMVAGMTRTRNRTEADREALDPAGRALAGFRDHAADLVDDDAAAYDEVVDAYRMPKGSEEEQSKRREAIQSALETAAGVPLEVMRLCQAGLAAALDVARHGNPAAASDVDVALHLLSAAAAGAALNVRANTGSLADRDKAAAIDEEASRLEASIAQHVREARAALGA